jgi:hypothetical protein
VNDFPIPSLVHRSKSKELKEAIDYIHHEEDKN